MSSTASTRRTTTLEEARKQRAAGVAKSKNKALKLILEGEYFYATGSLLMEKFHKAQGRTPPPLHCDGIVSENMSTEDLLKLAAENPDFKTYLEEQLHDDKKKNIAAITPTSE